MGVKYIEDINDEAMDAWITALRSGDFKQTFGMLGNERGHCCLGVYCEINPNVIRQIEYNYGEEEWGYTTKGEDYMTYLLPSMGVLESLNLPEEYLYAQGTGVNVLVNRHEGEVDESFNRTNGRVVVSLLNDNYRLTFDQIADRLEETFLRKESV